MRVRVLLAVLALLPLSGAGWFGYHDFRRAADSRDHAETIKTKADELVDIASLRAAILDEHNWTVTALGVAELGVPSEVVKELTGIDPNAELDLARADLDQLTDATGFSERIGQSVDAIRSADEPLVDIAARYLDLEAELRAESEAAVRDLGALAGEVSDGGALAARIRQLDAAINARQAVATQLTAYFSAQFAGPDELADHVQTLVETQTRYDLSMHDLRQEILPGSLAGLALAAVDDSDDVESFITANTSLVERLISSGSLGSTLTREAVFGNLAEIQALFEAGASSADVHLAVVQASQQDLDATATALNSAAAADARRTLWWISALALVSLLFTAILARFIGSPLQKLADAARRLRDGDTRPSRPAGGPREVRVADAALHESVANLELTRRQALALARAELDHPVLAETAPGQVGEALQDAVQQLASSLAEREQFRLRLAHEAAHDGLTRLPNRTASLAHLRQALARVMRSESTLALLFVDLDGFKAVNDRHGHQAGDAALRLVAQRLVSTVREGDHVGRLGGDEFLVVAEPVHDAAEATELARRLIESIEEPLNVDGALVEISACVGVGLAHDDRLSVDELLRDADLAVYQAKGSGVGRVEICDVRLKTELAERAGLEEAITRAIEGNELTVHYQPVLDARTGAVHMVEALVRWDRPDHGLVPPGDFIPVAERSNLIVDVDRWVIEHTIEQLAEWSGEGLLRDVPMAINVSGRTVGMSSFAETVLEVIDRHQVDPSSVVLEITETALLDDMGTAASQLERLRRRGVRVAIDDFGTGYTSLAHLRTLPIDVLKIDQSYTADRRFESLVKLMIDTGHGLGARITAEGIETAAQASRLTDMGADHLQGYLYGMPCPAHELRARLSPELAGVTEPPLG